VRALDQRKILAARLWAATRFPYLASALFAMRVVPADQAGVMAVDEGWRLHVDPGLVDTWSAAQFGSVAVHHVGHLLRDHADRAQALGVGKEQARRWRLAADAEINDDFTGAALEFPVVPVTPQLLGFAPHLFAEQYFRDVPVRRSIWHSTGAEPGRGRPSRGNSWGDVAGNADCGSGCDGLPRAWDGDGGLSESQQALLRCQVATEIVRYPGGRLAGTLPVGLRRWAEGLLGSHIDWRRVLAAEIRRALATASGMIDYSYRKPSRRAAAVQDVVLPGFIRPIPEVAVVIDTSGSMSAELLAQALAEVSVLLRIAGRGRGALRVIPCDAAAHGVQRIRTATRIELLGGGGTSMGAGIAAASALRPRPSVVVVLTDGFTPWPPEPPPGMTVVVGLLRDGQAEPPRWARVVRIESG
jgi:predicted metal-dependent peptidase